MTSRTVRLLTTTAATAALALAACGGDDSADNPTATSASPATTAAASTAESSGVESWQVGSSDTATGTEECPPPDGSSEQVQQFAGPPPMCIDPNQSYTATIQTNMGTLEAELFSQKAPNTVNNFVVLSRYRYFDNTDCHRIISSFMAQCGDPTGTGMGDPGYKFGDELPEAGEYQIGSMAMANSGPNTQGSQFFIITGPNGTTLPPDYTLFGQVTEGLTDVLTQIDAAGNNDPASNGMPPLEQVTIEWITVIES